MKRFHFDMVCRLPNISKNLHSVHQELQIGEDGGVGALEDFIMLIFLMASSIYKER